MPDAAAAELDSLLEGERAAGTFPSYQALVVEDGVTLFEAARGLAVVEPEERPATPGTLYDLASLTKPLVTALLALRLAEEGVLALDAPAGRVLDEMAEGDKSGITALDLLSHRAGLAAWAPLYLEVRAPVLARFARAAARRPLAHPPGTAVLYSDLGYLVLGALLERVSGRGLAELAARHVLAPLGRDDLSFPPRPDQRERTAATERGNAYERRLAGAAEDAAGFRRELIWGTVHDGNAAALGGVAPHAGLFGTARAVAALAAEYLDGGTLLGPAGRSLARADLTPFATAGRSAAWELARSEGSAAGKALAPDAMGHTGFAGTSVYLEPSRRRIYVLLTNRVHPVAREVSMNAVRRRFHELGARLAGAPRREVRA